LEKLGGIEALEAKLKTDLKNGLSSEDNERVKQFEFSYFLHLISLFH